MSYRHKNIDFSYTRSQKGGAWFDLKSNNKSTLGLAYRGLNNADVGATVTAKNDDFKNGSFEVFGKVTKGKSTYKAALDCNLNTRLFG